MTIAAGAAEIAPHLCIRSLTARSVNERANLSRNPPSLVRVARLEATDLELMRIMAAKYSRTWTTGLGRYTTRKEQHCEYRKSRFHGEAYLNYGRFHHVYFPFELSSPSVRAPVDTT